MKKIIFNLLLFSFLFNASANAQQELTLEEAVNIAVKNNPAVKINQAQEKEADAKLAQVHSTFLPQVDVLSKYFFTNNLPNFYPLLGVAVPVMNNGTPTGDNITLHPMSPFATLASDVFTTDVNMKYAIYAGGKRVNAQKTMKTLKQAYQMDTKETEASLTYKVKLVFYNNLFIEQVINVYNEVLKQLDVHHELAQKAYEEGVKSEFDIVTFESKIQGFKTKIVEMEGNKAIAKIAIKNLLAMSLEQKIVCKGKLEDASTLQYTDLPKVVKEVNSGNYKMQALLLKEQVLLHKKSIVDAGKKPTIFSFANFHVYNGMEFPPFNTTWRSGYAIGIGLKMPIFDGNMTISKSMEVKANIDKVKEYESGLSLQLRFETGKAMETLKSLEAQEQSTLSTLKVSQKAYEIAKIGYKNGVNTSIELNDAQLSVTKVKIQLLKIEKDIMTTKAQIEYLKGK